jgi:hypothetical protein
MCDDYLRVIIFHLYDLDGLDEKNDVNMSNECE